MLTTQGVDAGHEPTSLGIQRPTRFQAILALNRQVLAPILRVCQKFTGYL